MSKLIFSLPFGAFDLAKRIPQENSASGQKRIMPLFESEIINSGLIDTRISFDLIDQEFTVVREILFPVNDKSRDQGIVPVELSVAAIERYIANRGYDDRLNSLKDTDIIIIECLQNLDIMTPSYACISGQIVAPASFWLSVLPLGKDVWERYRSFPVMRSLDDLANAVVGTRLSAVNIDALQGVAMPNLAAIAGLATVMIEFVRLRKIAFEMLKSIQVRGLNRIIVGDTNSERGKAAMRKVLVRLQEDFAFLADIDSKLTTGELARIDWRGRGRLLLEAYCSFLRLNIFTLFVAQRSEALSRRIPGYEIEVMLNFLNGLPQVLTSFGNSGRPQSKARRTRK
jgi:hypothetical protein